MFKRVEVICSINPIQDGLFRGYSRMGRAEKPPPPSSLKYVAHILQ